MEFTTSSSFVGSLVLFPFATEQEGGDYKSSTWKLFKALIFQDRFWGGSEQVAPARVPLPRFTKLSIVVVFLFSMISFQTNIWNQLNRYFHSMSLLIVFLHEVRSTMVQIELKMDQEYLVLAEFLFAKFWGTPFPPLRRMFLAENTLWIWGISLYGKNPPNSIWNLT